MTKFNHPKNHVPTFGRAVYEGAISGPANSKVIDAETGQPIMPRIENETYSGIPYEVKLRVRSAVSGTALESVIDFQSVSE